MPTIALNGIDLYYETTGSGFPLVLCHENAGDYRAWEPQVRHFARRYRVVTWNYRGFPPSSVPQGPAAYAHDHLIADLRQLLIALGIERAHLAGHATGGMVALNFAIAHPEMVAGLAISGFGAGANDRAAWLITTGRQADAIERDGAAGIAAKLQTSPQRAIFRTKDPRGFEDYVAMTATFSPVGAAQMTRIAVMGRKTIFELQGDIERLGMPILVMVGDQDFPAFDACRFVRDHARFAGLAVLPLCGHTLNGEEPGLFNLLLGDFLAAVDAGRWGLWHA